MCESGADVPLSVFNSTGRCVDSVSFAAFAAGDYFQWPDHCIQESFGAEFDPFLVYDARAHGPHWSLSVSPRCALPPSCCSLCRVPNASQVVFKGFVPTNDSYSAFGGVQFTTKRELARIIEDMGIQRLFVMGLATVRTFFCISGFLCPLATRSIYCRISVSCNPRWMR